MFGLGTVELLAILLVGGAVVTAILLLRHRDRD